MNNDGYRLPFDIREYLRKKRASKILLLSAIEIAIVLTIIFAGERFFYDFALPSRITAYLIVALLPIVIFGRKLIDLPWKGTVIKVDVKTMKRVTQYGVRSRDNLIYETNVLFILIEKENGALVEKEYLPQKNTVKVGDRAYHFAGVPHIVYVHDDKKATIRCGICGTKNEPDADACWNCGLSLIKPEE